MYWVGVTGTKPEGSPFGGRSSLPHAQASLSATTKVGHLDQQIVDNRIARIALIAIHHVALESTRV